MIPPIHKNQIISKYEESRENMLCLYWFEYIIVVVVVHYFFVSYSFPYIHDVVVIAVVFLGWIFTHFFVPFPSHQTSPRTNFFFSNFYLREKKKKLVSCLGKILTKLFLSVVKRSLSHDLFFFVHFDQYTTHTFSPRKKKKGF
jgi:hypothetical protein